MMARSARVDKLRRGRGRTMPISLLFSSPSRIEVLRILVREFEPMTGRQLARAAGIGRQACADAIDALEKLGVVSRSFQDKGAAVAINRESVLVFKFLLPFFNEETKLARELRQSWLRDFARRSQEEEEELDP